MGLVALVLVACSGQTNPATEVDHDSAVLNAHVACTPGETGTFWFEIATVTGAPARVGPQRPFVCPADQDVSQLAEGLEPSTVYRFRIGVDIVEQDGAVLYGDSDGTMNGTNYDTFTTAAAPPPTDPRPWVTPVAPTTTLGVRGQNFTLTPGQTYRNVRFLGQWRTAAGAPSVIDRSVFEGPNGFPSDATGQRTTLLQVEHRVKVTNSVFRDAHGNSAVFVFGGGFLDDDGSWYLDNGHNPNRTGGENDDTQFAHSLYFSDGSSGSIKNSRIENSAAWGIHLFGNSVSNLTVDRTEIFSSGKAGVIFAGSFSGVHMTNMDVHDNGTYGADYFDPSPSGTNSIAGDFTPNPLGPYEPGLGQYVDVSGVNPPPPPPPLPTTDFTITPASPTTNQPVTFDWTGSCPSNPCTFTWIDEGPDGNGGNTWPLGTGDPYVRSGGFQVAGTKSIELTVTDSLGRAVSSPIRPLVVTTPPPPPSQCSDGVDNADPEDTLVDLADPGCANAADNDETNAPPPPPTQCSDGVDNADPEDTLIDLADPGCSSASDNDETNTPPPPPGCNRNATPATFAAQVSAATAGQTICLASGSYGTWAGTNKAITVKNAAGAVPTMRINFGSGDSGFTLEGMGAMGGSIGGGAANITVKNSAFNTCMEFSGAQTNTVFDNNTHNNIDATCGNTRIGLAGSGVTVKNSRLVGGDSDGFFVLADNVLVQNNYIAPCDGATGNHTDGLQFADPNGWPQPPDTGNNLGSNAVVRGNFFDSKPCANGYGQALTGFNSGSDGALIEDNVIDTTRPWGIELYSDDGSIIRHNTVRWYPDSICAFNGPECGQINLTCCPPGQGVDPPGSGTQVYDNVGVVTFGSATAARNDHNVSGQNVSFVGPLTTYAGFRLTSPKGTASDGLDVGIR